MKCPKCETDNRKEAKFCRQCGADLSLKCPSCGHSYPEGSLFCDECGCQLRPENSTAPEISVTDAVPGISTAENPPAHAAALMSERRYVTVLFSDLTGYTAMSEKLDPEEVKGITCRVFEETSKIISKYDGFIEKYAGDAIMAMFGVPTSHEDDPVRAVKAAREIHESVDRLNPELAGSVGRPLSMHTGITTGLVVTGDVNMEIGTHGVAGDTINSAARLSDLAEPGEIMIDMNTCRQIDGYFACEYVDSTNVKGKSHPIKIHKVISQIDRPVTTHRLSGVRADLIGRKAELGELLDAVENLRKGKGSIFSICGDAGTGKSRLIEEFKKSIDLNKIHWIEAHSYAYAQNIPYFPLIDLLNRVLNIEENDLPNQVKKKVETGVLSLVGSQADIIPYIGGLYSLEYPEVADVSPEFWKSGLQSAVKGILTALAGKAPTIFFLEDLHWADLSFIELLHKSYLEIRRPAIVLCLYRPYFNLFTGAQLNSIGKYYHEIQLQGLSPSDAQDMLESLLKTRHIPADLKRLVQSKAEGNPFYLEELVNSLIESNLLVYDNGGWQITKPIAEADIPSSIHAIITGRLDRLEKQTRRILQEASVIGRAFLYEILLKITEMKEFVDSGLSTLERMDLIRARALQPDLEYIFKHPLTQEVVYNGLLKKERQDIHEQVARIMETIFKNRLSEFYETLAFHYNKGRSVLKAVDYLVRSGEKSLARYAVEEAHQYFKEAFDLLSHKSDRTKKDDTFLIEMLNKWSLVYYYRGDFREQSDLLRQYMDLAEPIEDQSILGMFYAWYGFSLYPSRKLKESYNYLSKALEVGEQIQDPKVIGYACTWLAWTCGELGALDEAIYFGKRGHDMCQFLPSDQYLYFKSLGGIGVAYFFKGYPKEAWELGRKILYYGKRHSNIRSIFMGHLVTGYGHWADGDLRATIDSLSKSTRIAQDPFYSFASQCHLGSLYTLNDEFQKAEETLQDVGIYCQNSGCDLIGIMHFIALGLVQMANGQMGKGLKLVHDSLKTCYETESRLMCAMIEYILGKVYLSILDKSVKVGMATIARNLGFIIKHVPSAAKKANEHFNNAVSTARETGAKGIEGQALLDLGRLQKVKGRKEMARDYLSESAKIFEACEAEFFLKQAKEELANLERPKVAQ